MPNHIQNWIFIEKDDEHAIEVEEVIKGFTRKEGDDIIVDFGMIIPMPEELANTSSPTRIVSEKEYKSACKKIDEENNKNPDWNQKYPITEKMKEERLTKYGVLDWYDWSCAYWGTKWNAYESQVEDEYVGFQTAWSSPAEFIVALSKKYPRHLFDVFYADEDIGSNFGHYKILNGVINYEMIIPKSKKLCNKLAEQIWGGADLDQLEVMIDNAKRKR